MSNLVLREVRKVYRSKGKPAVEAVRNFDLEVASGELVGLLGPSGCGKSTTLRMIAGLEAVTNGDILVDGRTVADLRPQDRNIGIAFENYALYPPLTVRQNIAFGLDARKMKDTEKRVDDVARRIGLEELLDARPAALSSGQKQRVALARAVAREPDVLLLDEPLSHLDAAERDATRRELRRLQRELGYTTVLVTHDQEEALSLADRVVVMHNGDVQQVGTPDQIYDDPVNLFVAGFVGEPAMNFLDAVLEPTGALRFEGHSGLAASSRAVVVGVRPEDISLDGDIPATTVIFEDLMEYGLLTVELNERGQRLVVQTAADPLRGDTPGGNVTLAFPPDRTYVFDKDTGERIR